MTVPTRSDRPSGRSSDAATRSRVSKPRARRRDLWSLAIVALFAPAQLFAIGPLTVFFGNPGELQQGFLAVAPLLALPLFLSWLALVAIGLLLPARCDVFWRVALATLGVALWLQGSLWVGRYGALDGQGIDWSTQAGRTPVEMVIWLLLPVAALLLRKKLAPIVGMGTGALLLVQSLGLAVSAHNLSREDAAAPAATEAAPSNPAQPGGEPPPGLFTFSAGTNGLLLIPDAFHSDAFAAILEEDEAEARALKAQFEGFTFFREHMGAFPNTRPSLPAMLSGTRYDNDEPWSGYLRRSLQEGSVMTHLSEAGWEVDVATFVGSILRGPLTHRFRFPRPFASQDEVRFHESMLLLDISWFRHVPHLFKPWVYNDQAWRLQGLSKLARNVHHASNGKDFLAHFTDQLAVGRDKPVFKLVHVGIPHKPVVLDRTCRWIGIQSGKRDDYSEQARCAVRLMAALLERLRSLDLYDEMLIIIAADHGTDLLPRAYDGSQPPLIDMPWLVGRAMPLLMVKPPRATGPLRVSDAPTEITDVPATIVATLGGEATFADAPRIPGTSVFDLAPDQPRERRFDSYYWRQVTSRDESLPFVHRLAVDGPLRAASSWHDRGRVFPTGRTLPTSRLDVGDPDAREHLGYGWSWLNDEGATQSRWIVGDRAEVRASLPASAVRVSGRLRSPGFNDPQQVEIWIDGVHLATSQPPADEYVDITADLPAGDRPPVSNMTIRFSRHQRYGDDKRSVAVQIQSIAFTTLDRSPR